jgi:ribosomal protection tetracycline resistance protein
MPSKIRNIGILSHVDAGKTTVTEQMLFAGGALKSPGDVNKGTTVSDHLDIEKERGVSVWSTDVSFSWKGHTINLIDTPGHADFSAEVERSLQIMDAAILIVSAVEGIQSHTFALWEALLLRKIPAVIFINKIDRHGADFTKVLIELEKEFSLQPFVMFSPVNQGNANASIQKLTRSVSSPEAAWLAERSVEKIVGMDDELLEIYLEGKEIPEDLMQSKVKDYTIQRKLFPVIAGVAKNAVGISELLDAVVAIFPNPAASSGNLSALVYKVEQHPTLGRLAYTRVFDGAIRLRDKIFNSSAKSEGKVAQIKKNDLGKLIDHPMIDCHDIGIITGLPDVKPGDILGDSHRVPVSVNLIVPMMTVEILPADEKDFTLLANALEVMQLEDPRLGLRWYREEKELHLNLMGKIQMEIISSVLLQRFGVEANFGTPTVIYKEKPLKAAIGFAEYTMPKPCWAVVSFAIEPAPAGSGIVYSSKVSVDRIKQKYQNEIREAVAKSLAQGIKGWEVTDTQITLIDGEDHEIHSRPGDFNIAVPMALMNGLTQSGTALLEPLLNFVVRAPESLLGKISGDILLMRGSFETPLFDDDAVIITGKVPAATSQDYGIRLSSLSGGKARIRFSFAGYAPCSDDQGVIRAFKGVNPLDRSRWILHARGAFKADERR